MTLLAKPPSSTERPLENHERTILLLVGDPQAILSVQPRELAGRVGWLPSAGGVGVKERGAEAARVDVAATKGEGGFSAMVDGGKGGAMHVAFVYLESVEECRVSAKSKGAKTNEQRKRNSLDQGPREQDQIPLLEHAPQPLLDIEPPTPHNRPALLCDAEMVDLAQQAGHLSRLLLARRRRFS